MVMHLSCVDSTMKSTGRIRVCKAGVTTMPRCWCAWLEGGGLGIYNKEASSTTEAAWESESCKSGTLCSLVNTSLHLEGLIVFVSSFTLAMGGINAARTLHTALLENKLRTPQSFYDTTPTGRIINRFSKDIYVIDEVIPPTILMFLGTFFTSLSTMIVIIASTPLFAVVIVPLAILYFFVQVTRKISHYPCNGYYCVICYFLFCFVWFFVWFWGVFLFSWFFRKTNLG